MPWRHAPARHTDPYLGAAGRAGQTGLPRQATEKLGPDHGRAVILLAGADELMHHDPATAASWLTTASDLLPRTDPRRYDAQLLLAGAHLLLGRPDETRRGLRALVPQPTAPRASARFALYHGRASRLLDRRREARALFENGLRTADGDTGDVVPLHTEIAELALEDLDLPTAVWYAAAAAGLARGLADRTGEAGALAVLSLARLHAGDAAPARVAATAATAAAALIDAAPDAELIRDLASLRRLGAAESALDRLPDAERHLARGLTLSYDTGQAHVRGELLTSLAQVQLRRGCFQHALGSLTEARRAVLPGDVARAALIETTYAEVAPRSWPAWTSGTAARNRPPAPDGRE
ncbi:hypothetical protein I7412_28620 [Frankia sp. CN6]|uniref:Uncharacterized protein n=1 Tax=Frankia nepalensis TaxID=1836974 RepID=A0A937RF81_9ACTN|nr:hypothetical protein [Frankia nepalensis]MBL7631053.1 hypothetical protein [Frankia nepalensis]